MYIKTPPDLRMKLHNVANDRQFNEAVNQLAGTVNVRYSGPWSMQVNSGKDYLASNAHSVIQSYAQQLADGNVHPDSELGVDGHLTEEQVASLLHLATASPEKYKAALALSTRLHAIPHAAVEAFSDTTYSLHDLGEPDAYMDVDGAEQLIQSSARESPARGSVQLTQSPERVFVSNAPSISLNSPSSVKRNNLSVKPSKKARKK